MAELAARKSFLTSARRRQSGQAQGVPSDTPASLSCPEAALRWPVHQGASCAVSHPVLCAVLSRYQPQKPPGASRGPEQRQCFRGSRASRGPLRGIQDPVVATPWGFKSPLSDHATLSLARCALSDLGHSRDLSQALRCGSRCCRPRSVSLRAGAGPLRPHPAAERSAHTTWKSAVSVHPRLLVGASRPPNPLALGAPESQRLSVFCP